MLWDLSPVKGLYDHCNNTQTVGLPPGSIMHYLWMYLRHALIPKPHLPSLHCPSPPAFPIIFLISSKATPKYTHTCSFFLLNLPCSRNCISSKSNPFCVLHSFKRRGVIACRIVFCPVVGSCWVIFSLCSCSTICQICKILFTCFFSSLHQRTTAL